MMKQYIFSIILLLMTILSTAQDMSIEFSIEWKDNLKFQFTELFDKNIHPAYLNITYRNISNNPLYCLKVTEGKADLPEIVFFCDSMPGRNERSMLSIGDDYFKRRYFVNIKMDPYLNAMWDVCNDTTDIEYKIIKATRQRPVYDIVITNESADEFISPTGYIGGDSAQLCDWLSVKLSDIYNYIYHHYYHKTDKYKNDLSFLPFSTITKDSIFNTFIEKFVFLKQDEAFTDQYNLIGFQITGGTFTFQMDNTQSLDYIEVDADVNDKNTSEIIDEYNVHRIRKKLPSKVGEYELFTGNFLTNKVTIQFPGIKLKE